MATIHDSQGRGIGDDNPLLIKTSSYVGRSTETKPTVGVRKGSDYLELDTKNVFIFDGSIWVVL